MASFMRKRISAESGAAKPQFLPQEAQNGSKRAQTKRGSKNANDHEQQARVHPAQPTIPWSSRRRSYEASTSPLEAK
jgi:hypothetical protein